jgi:hypothetical protein
MMGKSDPPGAPIDRAAEANARGGNAVMAAKIRGGLCDLVANSRAARRAINLKAPAIEYLGIVIAEHDLQLGPADLDAEVQTFVHLAER